MITVFEQVINKVTPPVILGTRKDQLNRYTASLRVEMNAELNFEEEKLLM